MNRKQFWLRWIGGAIAMAAINAVCNNTNIPPIDALILFGGQIVLGFWSVRLIYLRAVDVGYVKAGLMTAGAFIPLFGIGVFLTIAFLPTGSRTGCTLPCWPSTQKRWAQRRQLDQRITAHLEQAIA